jgi:hypothetical protein
VDARFILAKRITDDLSNWLYVCTACGHRIPARRTAIHIVDHLLTDEVDLTLQRPHQTDPDLPTD